MYKKALKRLSKGKWILSLLVVTWVVYGYMLLYSLPHLIELANGMKPLDVLPTGYSSDYVRSLFLALGEGGRQFYLSRQIPIDMVYPALFIITYSLLTFYGLCKAGTNESLATRLSLIPVFAGICDYLENLGIVVMLWSFPDVSSSLATITSCFSVGKAGLTTVFWIVLLYALVAAVIRATRGRMREVWLTVACRTLAGRHDPKDHDKISCPCPTASGCSVRITLPPDTLSQL
ncbi:hypothetical protein GF356_05130 [candidate division GN15 bacterium]|nr:hypothetical protein [candidate division GN15 bacterium]